MRGKETTIYRIFQVALLALAMCACSEPSAEQSLINTLGVRLPPDAAPVSAQTLRLMAGEPRTLDATLDNYGTGASQYIFERLALLDRTLCSGVSYIPGRTRAPAICCFRQRSRRLTM